MKELLDFDLGSLITAERLLMALQALLILVVGWLVARMLSALVWRVANRRSTPQGAMLLRRLVFYPLITLTAMAVLNQLGFQLGVLLGAAGILTVAVGFASQTSASNLISGLFLVVERPFVVGDIVQIEGVTGEVLSIDLLSVKLRTFDNLYVRVPNETIIKSRVTNNTHFPIRRSDLRLGVAYKEDLEQVRRILLDVAEANPLVLADPQPLIIMQGFGESSLDLQFSVWTARPNFLDVRNQMMQQVKAAFDRHGVEIPFPHRTVYTGAECLPLPVRVVRDDGPAGPPDGSPQHDDRT
jgi:small-conductance mechanosensitive channel